jgi:hypothetical protein
MAQTYKLRLSDGTQLVVDYAGLRTWTADDAAMVQSSGWRGWRQLRDVLAEEELPPQPGAAPAIRLKPPTPVHELPSLRLASNDEEYEEEGDVYGYDEPGVVGIAWLWTKRLVLTGALAIGGFYAYLTWETWLPKAGEFGRMVIAQIESRTQTSRPAPPLSAEETEQKERADALRVATEQLPYLTPDTVEKVMSSSVAGVLDPPEIFRRAHDAAERGTSSLSAAEAQELRALRQNIEARLTPAERERLREYDLARGVRVTMPFEDKAALGAVARGARALPPASRERLRLLSAKAVAAGLATAETRRTLTAAR